MTLLLLKMAILVYVYLTTRSVSANLVQGINYFFFGKLIQDDKSSAVSTISWYLINHTLKINHVLQYFRVNVYNNILEMLKPFLILYVFFRLSRRRRRKRSKRNNSKDCQEKTYDASERLIIDKAYFFEKLKIISNHAPQFGCNLSNMDITGETKIGLISKLKLTCNMCNGNYFIYTSDPEPTENLDVNTAAVSSISNAGIGLEQFLGICSGINLPTLSQKN